MEAVCRREGVEGVRETHIRLVRGGGGRGRGNEEVLNGPLQGLPVGLLPHGPGGGAFVGWHGEADEDGDVI